VCQRTQNRVQNLIEPLAEVLGQESQNKVAVLL
jgi:hypothetical protein